MGSLQVYFGSHKKVLNLNSFFDNITYMKIKNT